MNLERSSKPVSRVLGPVRLFQLLSFVTSLHLLPASFNRKKPLYVLTGLLRVRLPPFGNTIFEATIPLSVTFIMSQFEGLTTKRHWHSISTIRYGLRIASLPVEMGISL